jgi:drug/metabolite transporter (DMT)-like permease
MSRRSIMLFILLSIVWGIPYLMIKVAVSEVPVPFLVFARTATGALVLLPLAWRQGGWRKLAEHWVPVTAFAVVEMIIPWGLLSHGEIRLNSSTAGLLIAATPILAVAIGKLTGDAVILGARRAAGLVLGFAGVFVLAAPELGGDLWSITEVLLAATCYAVGSIIASRWLRDVPTMPMTLFCLALAALVYLPPAVATWPVVMPSARALTAIAALAVVCTAFAFSWFFELIRDVGGERAVIITYIAPAVAVAAGVLLLAEPFSARVLASFGLILCGSYLAAARASQRPLPADVALSEAAR